MTTEPEAMKAYPEVSLQGSRGEGYFLVDTHRYLGYFLVTFVVL